MQCRKLFLSSMLIFVLFSFSLIISVWASSMMWSQTYGTEEAEMAYSLVETSDGGYALAGYAESFGAGSKDFWLVKTDADGNIEWEMTYGGALHDIAFSLVATSDGGYALTGYTNSFGAGLDFWLVKTDANGNMEWNQTYGGAGDERAKSLVETSDGGYALAGNKLSGADMNFWLIKTDEHGIIPEFPSWVILPLLLVATLVAIIYKQRLQKRQACNN